MTVQPVILTVDRNLRNLELLDQFLAKAKLPTLGVSDLDALHAYLDTAANTVALALVDVTGFDAMIWTVCERLRTSDIPLLVLSPRQSSAIQNQGLAHGAHAVLVKPLVSRELITLIKSLMRTDL